MRYLIATLALAGAIGAVQPAEAKRPRQTASIIHCDDRGCSNQDAPKARRGSRTATWSFAGVGRPNVFVRGRLTCARNVNAALASMGIRGTGSAMAKSFLNWGRPSAPVPGAVAVYNRGGRKGHVAIVSRVEGGHVYVWNPGRGGWREVVYPKSAIAYRVAG